VPAPSPLNFHRTIPLKPLPASDIDVCEKLKKVVLANEGEFGRRKYDGSQAETLRIFGNIEGKFFPRCCVEARSRRSPDLPQPPINTGIGGFFIFGETAIGANCSCAYNAWCENPNACKCRPHVTMEARHYVPRCPSLNATLGRNAPITRATLRAHETLAAAQHTLFEKFQRVYSNVRSSAGMH